MKKKNVSALMCTALVASMLVGCGSGETNPPADASDAAVMVRQRCRRGFSGWTC